MNVWELCIRRAVFTVMLVSAPIVLGLAAYPRLHVAPRTRRLAAALLGSADVPATLRRVVTDADDDLGRALAARA